MSALDTSIIFIYLGLMIAIGLYANYRQKNVEDYYVAGRRLGPFSIACLWRRADANAAFWSIALSLPTVIVWKMAASAGFEGVFSVQPLWPGLIVSAVSFIMISAARRDGHGVQ